MKKTKYAALGKFIQDERIAANLLQSELAKQLDLEQQTVSRWESGQSRPTEEKANQLIQFFKIKEIDAWLNTSGYRNLKPFYEKVGAATPMTTPFPLQTLSDKDFERFCLSVIEFLYPEGTSYLYGSQGHKQEGIDIRTDFSDGTCFTYQCKRHKNFGPAMVEEAIKKHSTQSNKKIIFLSRTATPRARDAAKAHPEWEIWDIENISHKIRSKLSADERQRLVKTFFPGHELTLLGFTSSSPWQTPEEFFLSYSDPSKIFNHSLKLIGRTKELDSTLLALENVDVNVIIILGAAGIGKSRLLKEICDKYQKKHKRSQIRIAAPHNEKITKQSIDDLGTGAKLLVIDEAHDNDRDPNDINLLLNITSKPTSNIKLILLTRPYTLERINISASKMGVTSEAVTEIKLQPLTQADATEISKQILTIHQAPIELAEQIAAVTHDSPLATVLGSYIIAKSPKNLVTLSNEEEFKKNIRVRFQDIITGNIGTESNKTHIREILKFITFFQPINSNDPRFLSLAKDLLQMEESEIKKLLNLLDQWGVLSKTGKFYSKIIPNALSDFIVEDACFDRYTTTGYAKTLFEKTVHHPLFLEKLIFNLGKLDWRLSQSSEANNQILTPIWQQLKGIDNKKISEEEIIEIATNVAFYQPINALDLADTFIEKKSCLHLLPNLLKNIAYSPKHTREACFRLWEIGKNDARPANQNLSHPIRVLSELCEIKPGKGLEYTQQTIEYALSLMEHDASWNNIQNPLEVALPALATEAEKVELINDTFNISFYCVNPDIIKPIREKVISSILKLLMHKDKKRAILAAQAIRHTLQYPRHNKDFENRDNWSGDFILTLLKIKNILTEKATQIDDVILVELHRSIFWHENYAPDNVKKIAKEVVQALPSTPEYRATKAFMDGWGQLWEKNNTYSEKEKLWKNELEDISQQLLLKYTHENLLILIDTILDKIDDQKLKLTISPQQMLNKIISVAPLNFSKLLVEKSLTNQLTYLKKYIGQALSKIILNDRKSGLSYSKKLLELNDMSLKICVAQAYNWESSIETQYNEDEIKLIKELCDLNDRTILSICLNHLTKIANYNVRQAIDLWLKIDFNFSAEITDIALSIFTKNSVFSFDSLKEYDYEIIFEKMLKLNSIHGYWVGKLIEKISEIQPEILTRFLKKRVEYFEDTKDPKYQPIPEHYQSEMQLRFRKTNDIFPLMKDIRNWICYKDAKETGCRLKLFVKMFEPVDIFVINFLQEWLYTASSEKEIIIISQIIYIGSQPSPFDITNYRIIENLLQKSEIIGLSFFKQIETTLYRASIPKIKSGAPGTPFKEDLLLKNSVNDVLNKLEGSSITKNFYLKLLNHADLCIKEQSNGSD